MRTGLLEPVSQLGSENETQKGSHWKRRIMLTLITSGGAGARLLVAFAAGISFFFMKLANERDG
jgi:hypothetical protein